jgi:hypothetical protein
VVLERRWAVTSWCRGLRARGKEPTHGWKAHPSGLLSWRWTQMSIGAAPGELSPNTRKMNFSWPWKMESKTTW